MPERRYNIVYMIDGLGMGGAERLMVPILKYLPRQHFNPRVCVFQIRDGNPIAEQIAALGIPVDFLNIPFMRDVTALPRAAMYLKQAKADLVHGQLELGDIIGSLAAKLLRLPSVSTLHTMPAQNMSFKSKLHQEVEFFVLRHFCDTVISVSNEARQFYLDISTFSPSKLITIYNGIELASFHDVDRKAVGHEVRNEFGIPSDAKLILTVAVLRELKGIQFMIRALPGILSVFPNTYYLIVGDGSYKDELEREVDRIGTSGDRVIFAGHRDNVLHYMTASDLFVLPTLTEALPTVLAEAMSVRLPIIATTVGGIPEMIVDGHNGILVPAADIAALQNMVVNLLSNPKKRESLGDAGRDITEQKFNVQVQAKLLSELYLSLIKKSN